MKKRRFLDNIFVDGDEDNPPTLAEYQKQRAAEEQRDFFLKGSRDIDKAKKVEQELTKEEKDELALHNEAYIDEMVDLANSYANRFNISPIEATIELRNTPYGDTIEDNDVRRYTGLRETLLHNINVLKNGKKRLSSCLATATCHHPFKGHYVTGNQTFAANPGKYGWKKVPASEIKPGGIIQQLDEYGVPRHAVILDTIKDNKRYVNYSTGNTDEYKKQKPDWRDKTTEKFYNFVGNSADSLRWEKEYNEKYGIKKRLGGSTRHSLKDGGIYIKPSHRGRFTALKERTGHSATWFKENGTPAQKKMATFALNAAKWKH